MEKSNKKRKVTLFLDTETLLVLDSIGQDFLGSNSKSGAVRFLAKEYEKKQRAKKENI